MSSVSLVCEVRINLSSFDGFFEQHDKYTGCFDLAVLF